MIVTKRQAYPWLSACHLRDTVLPTMLASATHHDDITAVHRDGSAWATSPWSQPKHPGTAERKHSNDRVQMHLTDPIAMPCDRVAPIAVEVGSDSIELLGVTKRKCSSDLPDDRREAGVVGIEECTQARNRHDPVIHRPLERLPRQGLVQRRKEIVRAMNDVSTDINPASLVELNPLQRA